MTHRILSCLILLLFPAAPVSALDHVTIRSGDDQKSLSGRVRVTAQDGGLLFQTRDGQLLTIQPEAIAARSSDETEFEPLTQEEMAAELLREFPQGFDIHTTSHWVICHNTSRPYAAWCGALFERLYRGFTNFWGRRGLDLSEPAFPLVAIVFADRDSYVRYAREELGDAAEAVSGFYSLKTNRMTMHDLTGLEELRQAGDRRATRAQINAMLSRPAALRNVATVIHEATHQIAYNTGLQTRYADNPVWVSEGLAVYFETPDLRSDKGWRTIGAVNRSRLGQFRQYARERPADSLKTLVASDARFRDTRQAAAAYAEAWALVYYLLRGPRTQRQFSDYLKSLSEKGQLIWDEPEDRLRQFEQAFGPIEELDADFLRYIGRLR